MSSNSIWWEWGSLSGRLSLDDLHCFTNGYIHQWVHWWRVRTRQNWPTAHPLLQWCPSLCQRNALSLEGCWQPADASPQELPEDNITKEQQKVLKEIRSWKDEVILCANKGNATVVSWELLDDTSTYHKLPKDPLHSKNTMARRSRQSCTTDSDPRIFGLPKILRPIVSCIGLQYIAPIISPLVGRSSSHVLNSKHFAETMRDITVGKDELLVSFDMSSLFTNVPSAGHPSRGW